MAATRAESRAREIFAKLEYGPAPESHACALVRACGPALPLPLCLSPPLLLPRGFCALTPVIPRGSSAPPPFFAPPSPAAGERGSLELLRLCPARPELAAVFPGFLRPASPGGVSLVLREPLQNLPWGSRDLPRNL